jgi:hypothetical protein
MAEAKKELSAALQLTPNDTEAQSALATLESAPDNNLK